MSVGRQSKAFHVALDNQSLLSCLHFHSLLSVLSFVFSPDNYCQSTLPEFKRMAPNCCTLCLSTHATFTSLVEMPNVDYKEHSGFILLSDSGGSLNIN